MEPVVKEHSTEHSGNRSLPAGSEPGRSDVFCALVLGVLAAGLVAAEVGQESAARQQESVAPQQETTTRQQESAAPQGDELWTARRDDACVGLTVAWTVPVEALEGLVGPTWRPAAANGRGSFGLFGARCEGSVIDGTPTGPFRMAALITDVEPVPGAPELWLAPPGAAVPAVVGEDDDPVIELFRRHGFAVSEGEVELHVEPAESGARAGLRVVLPDGHVTVQAHLEPATESFEAGGAGLMATTPGVIAGFDGPESATRWASGSAAVTTAGDTWISRLGLGPTPDSVALDTSFVWRFRFWSREIRGR